MATGVLVIAICSSPASGAVVAMPAAGGPNSAAAPVHLMACPTARQGLRFYQARAAYWTHRMGSDRKILSFHHGGCPRYLATLWRSKSHAARSRAEVWIEEHVLHDFRVGEGARAWHRAVREAQRPYPGTDDWLMSCSASEGGWGRWVPNSQGSGVGGWLQFYPSTFAGFIWRARVDAARRGYIVPASAASWYSPLGQALAGAWGITHGMRHHWAGSGCW